MSIGPWQIIIIVLLLVVLFGRGKISELMGDVAKGIKSFKKGIAEETDEAKETVADTAKTIELEAEELTEKTKDKAKS
ncbi:MAG: twin-arginine translocase TatA/TatE family subunit [Anderseniella sp.]|nr:twin-arginine translocase TatA/TatE family subunit [Anderseniella sp.]